MEIATTVSKILAELSLKIAPGVALLEIDTWAKELMDKYQVESCNYKYQPKGAGRPFPGYLCTSVNDTIAHGVPGPYRLVSGDIINLDIGIKRGTECADAAFTLPVGEIKPRDLHLLRYSKRVLYAGIEAVKDGALVTDIGFAMGRAATQYGFKVNKNMAGHTIGAEMHMKPFIPHFYEANDGYFQYFDGVLHEGMIICLEPMLTYGNDEAGFVDPDMWSFRTRDGKNSAMFEHMIRVEKSGFKILTNHFDNTWFEKDGKYAF